MITGPPGGPTCGRTQFLSTHIGRCRNPVGAAVTSPWKQAGPLLEHHHRAGGRKQQITPDWAGEVTTELWSRRPRAVDGIGLHRAIERSATAGDDLGRVGTRRAGVEVSISHEWIYQAIYAPLWPDGAYLVDQAIGGALAD